jgi:hypothetical protein
MTTLQNEVDTLDNVAEGHRQHYVQKEGGGYHLDSANIETRLEAQNVRKLAAHEQGLKEQVASLRADRDAAALGRGSHEIAGRLAVPGSAEVLLPHIRARLVASDVGGVFTVTVKDAPSVEHLTEQLRADPKFSRLIVNASPVDQARHLQKVNETLGLTPPVAAVTRSQFEQMTSAKRSECARAGTKIVDS